MVRAEPLRTGMKVGGATRLAGLECIMATLAKRSGLWSTRPIILIGSAGYGFSGPKEHEFAYDFRALCRNGHADLLRHRRLQP